MSELFCCECGDDLDADWVALTYPKGMAAGELLCDECADEIAQSLWTQCDDYYNCGGCCSAGRDLLAL